MSIVLNEKYNHWYSNEFRTFIEQNDVKHHPERIKDFIFDLYQQKIDTINITNDEIVKLNIPSHLQTTADVHCIGRQTVYDNLNKAY